MSIEFRKYYVTDGINKALVRYSLDNRHDGRKCVTMYEKGYDCILTKIFSLDDYKNDTDSQLDYYCRGRVNLFEDSPLYTEAREAAEAALVRKEDSGKVDARIVQFAADVEAFELSELIRHNVDCESNRRSVKTRIVAGKKYIRVDVGTSGKYMIASDGNIYGIKAYGVPHLGHRYGTIDNPIIRARY